LEEECLVSENTRLDKVGILGGGVMGEAIIGGLIRSGFCAAANIAVSDVSQTRLDHLAKNYKVRIFKENSAVIAESGLLVLCVKPDAIQDLLRDVGSAVREQAIVVSIAAGVKLSTLISNVKSKVVRAMPNICAQSGAGMTALSHTSNMSQQEMDVVKKLFESIGKAIWVDESKMDAVTAVSGSGPAYIFLVMEAMVQGGVENGLTLAQSRELVYQTVKGAVKMVDDGGNPADLREKIMSPNGTTAAALHELESNGVRGAFLDAISAAARRSKELGA
jgi:pyrroline-5-carboxylate reductase